ncbi:SDR family NAD(P)-dependent oxidoreductase [Pedobacter alpinus]|uniref:SDR family NAD(P)-dependent oxidoreductase n=1 Tax=Pedobacter alpinus TaxID=1590643 RepID=A0ABW5TQP8_9SPHI
MDINQIKRIAIIGCGWLGFPLAKHFQKNGYLVNGSTTNINKLQLLAENNIAPFLIQLPNTIDENSLAHFLNADLLIINVPPGRSEEKGANYGDKMEHLKTEVLKSNIKKIIFISSTSVYDENNGWHTEESNSFANTASGLRMLAAEKTFTAVKELDVTVIRMAGLIGPERHPGRFFAGKEAIPNGLVPVNLIHLEDCIGVIEQIINQSLWNQTFNAAAPTHPSKSDFYDLASRQLYNKRAQFIKEKKDFKIISADKIVSTGYQFKHPDLMQWLVQNHQN